MPCVISICFYTLNKIIEMKSILLYFSIYKHATFTNNCLYLPVVIDKNQSINVIRFKRIKMKTGSDKKLLCKIIKRAIMK